MVESSKVLDSYFGKWGGFFVPDPMTPALDGLKETVAKLIKDASFAKKIDEIAQVSTENMFIPSDAANVFSAQSIVKHYIAAGYAFLAKETATEVVAGAFTAEEAKIISGICKKVGVQLSIWLNVKTGADEALVKSLTDAGNTVNVDQCRELFDDPEMYSFQKYIANPMKYLWIPIHSHAGPAPFPAITMHFSSLAAKKMVAAAEKKFTGKKLNFAGPAIAGLSLVGILAANEKNIVNLSSYGPKADSQREECYLGAYTMVLMTGKTEFVLSPVLVHAWESGTVKRVDTVAPLTEFAKGDANAIYVVMEE
jgi:tryptophan synthase beta subunit